MVVVHNPRHNRFKSIKKRARYTLNCFILPGLSFSANGLPLKLGSWFTKNVLDACTCLESTGATLKLLNANFFALLHMLNFFLFNSVVSLLPLQLFI